MILQELLALHKDDMDLIEEEFKKNHPLFEDYEVSHYGMEKVNEVYNKFFERFAVRYKELLTLKTKPSNDVIFIVRQKNVSFDEAQTSHIHSFNCKKDAIIKVMSEEFVLWNDNAPRIEHYCYDFAPIEDLLGMEVFYNDEVNDIEAIVEVLHETFMHGFQEDERKESLDKFMKEIEESMKDVEAGNFVDADTVFEELENSIYKNETPEEHEERMKQKAIKESHKNRDTTFLHIATRINHKKCISIIEEWCLAHLLDGEINL
jgi:hypothetical protein